MNMNTLCVNIFKIYVFTTRNSITTKTERERKREAEKNEVTKNGKVNRKKGGKYDAKNFVVSNEEKKRKK